MKRLLSYLLLLMMIIFSVSACGSKSDAPVAATTTYLSVQVRADAGNDEVTLDWQMVGGAATYNIYYIADPTGSTYSSTNKPSSATMKGGTKVPGIISATKTITGLQNGTTYWFAISAVTSSVESDLSIAISATPSTTAIPAAPENVRANAGDAKVTVTWTPVAGVDHYTVYCYTQSGLTINEGIVDLIPQANSSQVVDSTTIHWTQGSNVTSSPNAGLVNGTTYYFFVVSVNAIGKTNTSFFESATPSTTPPPFAPVLTSVTQGTFVISSVSYNTKIAWDAPVTGTATSYNIYIGTAKGVTKSTGAVTNNISPTPPLESYANLAGGTYYIVVTAVNTSSGESAESNELSVTIL